MPSADELPPRCRCGVHAVACNGIVLELEQHPSWDVERHPRDLDVLSEQVRLTMPGDPALRPVSAEPGADAPLTDVQQVISTMATESVQPDARLAKFGVDRHPLRPVQADPLRSDDIAVERARNRRTHRRRSKRVGPSAEPLAR